MACPAAWPAQEVVHRLSVEHLHVETPLYKLRDVRMNLSHTCLVSTPSTKAVSGALKVRERGGLGRNLVSCSRCS